MRKAATRRPLGVHACSQRIFAPQAKGDGRTHGRSLVAAAFLTETTSVTVSMCTPDWALQGYSDAGACQSLPEALRSADSHPAFT
jgi:hypothetical protein